MKWPFALAIQRYQRKRSIKCKCASNCLILPIFAVVKETIFFNMSVHTIVLKITSFCQMGTKFSLLTVLNGPLWHDFGSLTSYATCCCLVNHMLVVFYDSCFKEMVRRIRKTYCLSLFLSTPVNIRPTKRYFPFKIKIIVCSLF